MLNLDEVFEKFADDYIEFERVENKLHTRPDICEFLLLDKLVPNPGHDMVAAGEHDKIWLDVDCKKLAAVATEDDILMLTRCGVQYDDDVGSLAMFV